MHLLPRIKSAVVSRFLSYSDADLDRLLTRVGLKQGDTLMVHSSWRVLNGYSGSPSQFCAVLRNHIGPGGLLVMPSLTYHNMSSAEFLATGKPMDVRRTPSAMGLLSEVFRRGREVRRSLSPTHPLLAWGVDADSFIGGHEATDRPFGPDSPFNALLQRNALLLCLDCDFSSVTFTHFVEDHIADTLAFPLYESEPRTGYTIDRDGNHIECRVRVLSTEANRLRREPRLIAYLARIGVLQRTRLGNSTFMWIRAADMLAGAKSLINSGGHFFDAPQAS